MSTLLNPYTTLADIKSFCGVSASDFDDRIKTGINQASRLIDAITSRFFYKKTYTDYYIKHTGGGAGWQILARPYDKRRGGVILTPQNAPIISVTSIYEDDVLLVENDDYYLDIDLGQIERLGSWPQLPRTIKMTCNIGYDTADTETPSDDLPGDIAYYTLEIAARLSGRYHKEQPGLDGTIVNINSHNVPKWIVDNLKKMKPIYL